MTLKLSALSSLSIFALFALTPLTALAGPDYFSLGNGQDGALSVSAAQTVINSYVGVTTAQQGALSMEVDDATTVEVGDLLMVWQTSATLAAPPASGDQGPFDIATQGAGFWEFARVTQVTGSTITLADALLNTYSADGAQVIVVPEYTSITLAANTSVTAPDWDGNTGGIVVALVQGDVSLATGASFDVDFKGFRGGADRSSGSGDVGCTGLDEPFPRGFDKGEGYLFDFFGNTVTGRGNRGTGGGGGICHNSGGGGGGHGGEGGLGGRTWIGDQEPGSSPPVGRNVGGLGGAEIEYPFETHLSFGGGGGSGQHNNNTSTGGGDGGGAIFLRASSLTSQGTFSANGGGAEVATTGDTPATAGQDGAGGGGAGGAIVLRIKQVSTCGAVSATGGHGGDTVTTNPHGTGGGGAGGRVLVQFSSGTCAPDVSNGSAGIYTDTDDNSMSTYGATPATSNEAPNIGDVETPGGGSVGFDPDTDGDGIWDIYEGTKNSDSDPLPDYLDTDDDGDGLPTIMESADPNGDGNPDDAQNTDLALTNGDALPDYLDANDDGDALSTLSEDLDGDGDYAEHDTDGDGIPDYLDPNDQDGPTGDLDGDGIDNTQEGILGTLPDNADSDGDGLCDGVIAVVPVCVAGEDAAGGQNSDGDALIDALDADDDGDGVLTSAEDTDLDGDPTNDVGANGPRYLDPCDPSPNALACGTGDLDGDGLTNTQELALGTLPDNADSDNDGLCDGTQDVAGVCTGGEDAAGGQNSDTDLLIDALDDDDDNDSKLTRDEDLDGDGDYVEHDSDGDGISDWLDPDDDDGPLGGGDSDGDGISNAQETALGTLINNADSDSDGLCDGVIAVVPVCVAGEDAAGGQNSDGDALIDALDADDDGDGVLTSAEDTDLDGDPTNDVGANGPRYLDPCDPNPDALACPTGDADGDGVDNQTELMAPVSDPLDPCDPDPNHPLCDTGDLDGDGISNSQEVALGTLADNADSDGDGLCDGTVAVAGVCVAGEDAAGGQNSDGDALIDALDADDDGDGVLTQDEDLDADGDPTNDNSDDDTIPNYLDEDDDNDGVLTRFEDLDGDGDPANDNSDAILGDTRPNYLDADDDGDGVLTQDEDADPNGDGNPDDAVDTSMNSFADYLDPCSPDPTSVACLMGDTDGDGFSNDPSEDPEPLNPCVPNADALACPTGDPDMDGLTNEQEATLGTLPGDDDSDGDGVKDGVEVGANPLMPQDTDGDDIIDALDDDDDGDGIPTLNEDLDGDGDPRNDDTDGDMVPDYLDTDDDGDGVLTRFEVGDMAPLELQDTDMDMVPDYLDADDDGDGIPTQDEGADPNGDGNPDDAINSNPDTAPDYLDPEFPANDAVDITSPADGSTVSPDFVVSGTATPEAQVEVLIDGVVVGTTTADEDGDWSVEVTAQPPGVRVIEANVGGATDTVSVTVDEALEPATVSITSPTQGSSVPGAGLEISGTATPGADIEVFVDGESVGVTMADESGEWSVTVDLEPGMKQAYAEVTTPEGMTERSSTVSFTATGEGEEVDANRTILVGGCQQAPANPAAPGLGMLGLLAGLAFWRRRKRS